MRCPRSSQGLYSHRGRKECYSETALLLDIFHVTFTELIYIAHIPDLNLEIHSLNLTSLQAVPF